jgi:nitrite reductase/ring-hydroxylating ferredoxin subunit
VPLVICNLNGQLYAYRDHCPACNLPLHLGQLEAGLFRCRLGHAYDIQHAGQPRNGSQPPLAPFPLLIEDGQVKVAVEVTA